MFQYIEQKQTSFIPVIFYEKMQNMINIESLTRRAIYNPLSFDQIPN